MSDSLPTPADLRALRARLRTPVYVIATAVGAHPSRLGRMLNEREPMPPEMARRIARALNAEVAAIQEAASR